METAWGYGGMPQMCGEAIGVEADGRGNSLRLKPYNCFFLLLGWEVGSMAFRVGGGGGHPGGGGGVVGMGHQMEGKVVGLENNKGVVFVWVGAQEEGKFIG